MKKVFLILGLLAVVTSCSLDDDGKRILDYNLQPIVDYEIPDTLIYGNRYNFKIRYISPSTCNTFIDFDYRYQDSTRFVYVIDARFEDEVCTETPTDTVTKILNFETLNLYDYIFKFYTGDDEDGNPTFITDTIPVKQQ